MKLLSSCFTGLIIAWSMWCCDTYKDPVLEQQQNKFKQQTGYDLSSPSEKFLLPDALDEISGLSYYRANILACVQDELGTIFLYDLQQKEIVNRFKFARNGDFEGLAVANQSIFVVKSNGDLYQYLPKADSTVKIKTPLSSDNDVEGLAYDARQNRLLMACKESPDLKEKKAKGKALYGYALSGGFNPSPVVFLEEEKIERWNDVQLIPMELTKKLMGFKPSGVAVNPLTQQIFILAHEGKVVIVTDSQGAIQHMVPISPWIFKQPEGICFAPNGDLYISNEARDGLANILKFKYQPSGKEG